ncbi:MAG TPA: cytochrome P450 [Acidimicrobiales bacterium]
MTPDERGTPEATSAARLVQEFDHWDPELAKDPFSVYDGLRAQCPVAHSDAYGGFFVLSRYEDIEAAARDHETFSSRSISVPDPGVMPSSPPLDLDPPRHTAFRRVLLPYFSPGRTQKLEPITRAVAAGLVQDFVEQGHCDVARDFAKHVPIAVLSHVLGVEPGDEELFSNWTDLIVSGGPDPEVSANANVDIRDYFARLIEERSRQPEDDLATFLVNAEVENEAMSTADQLGVASLLLVAGIDTTWCMLGTSFWWLAQHADARQRLIDDPALWPNAVEELLRRFGPVSVVRIVTKDVSIDGQMIPEDEHVLLPFPAGNLDEEAFPEPYSVQLDRAPNRHLAFGAGVHRCIGAHLARMELRVGLEEFLRAIPDFELDGDDPVSWKPGQIRGPSRLLLRWSR